MIFKPTFIGYPADTKSKILKRIVNKKSITEAEFVENYENIKRAIRETIGWQNYNRARHEMELYDKDNFSTIDVVGYNTWAKPENISDQLKLFLKLNGENI